MTGIRFANGGPVAGKKRTTALAVRIRASARPRGRSWRIRQITDPPGPIFRLLEGGYAALAGTAYRGPDFLSASVPVVLGGHDRRVLVPAMASGNAGRLDSVAVMGSVFCGGIPVDFSHAFESLGVAR